MSDLNIPSTSPDLVTRQREINIQIGLDMQQPRMQVTQLRSCCDKNHTSSAENYQPTIGNDVLNSINQIATITTGRVPAKLKRDIKMLPVDEYGTMDMVLTDDGDLLHDSGLETAVLMSLFSDRRYEGERGWWVDELLERETGSHFWLLVREKTTTNEHCEGNILLRAEDYGRQALQWMIDSGEALAVDVVAKWGEDKITERMLLDFTVHLPQGSRFIGY